MKKISEADAVALIRAGLEAGVIKLKGSDSATSEDAAKTRAGIDSAYLLTLFRKLQGDAAE